ncbi:ATPase [Steroidobacter denitrificans]|uniref:ATPase n=1 Tax=Steroidobacter denitrificans TaxID=465721 RepID=A0A127FC80_STEDE|nr:F0F1 ATP synthase subunit gamma [Steroidobacter denitrificans]AMN48003.1 ATPase [Steroidobacter denitrificans]
MAQTLELLTLRTETMRGIRSIVRTMKTMSAINAQPYEQAARAIGAYRQTVLDGLHAFVQCYGPLPAGAAPQATPVVIAFGSDHGLCGNYNEIVAAEAARTMQPHTCATRLICVGARMEEALAGRDIQAEATLFPPATPDGLQRLAASLITRLDAIRLTAPAGDVVVSLVFMQRAGHGRQFSVSQRLLPLDPALVDALVQRPWSSRSLPRAGLPADRLLAALIRNYLLAELTRAAAEALLTENATRLARMQQAEQSVDERLEALAAEVRTVRQDEITTELLDVIIGFEALKERDRSQDIPRPGS